MLTEAAGDSPEFGCGFDDVLVVDAGFVVEDKLLDLCFERGDFVGGKSDFALTFARPDERAVERLRGQVGGEE